MQDIDHPNCVRLRNSYFTTGTNPDEVYLNLVMDYIPENLYKICKYYRK